MPYAAVADMVAFYGEAELARLTAPEDARTSGPDTARILRALADASDLVDTHLRRRYAVPLAAPVTPMVTRATADIAHLMLASQGDATVSDKVKAAYDAALKWLDGLAEGRLSLDGLQTNTGPMTTDRRRTLARGMFDNGGFGGFEWAW